MSNKDKQPTDEQIRARKVNWALYAVRGARGAVGQSRWQIMHEMKVPMPVAEYAELEQIREQFVKAEAALRDLDWLLVQHNLNKVSRTLDKLREGK